MAIAWSGKRLYLIKKTYTYDRFGAPAIELHNRYRSGISIVCSWKELSGLEGRPL
jgi:hypothetical protein